MAIDKTMIITEITTEYILISAPIPDAVAEAVNICIKRGWQPIGGIAVANATSNAETRFCQAMIRTTRTPRAITHDKEK